MPGLELNIFDSRIDQVSKKLQEIKSRDTNDLDETMDTAMNAVENATGRQEAKEAQFSVAAIADELAVQEAAMHHLDAAKVASLISDPFED